MKYLLIVFACLYLFFSKSVNSCRQGKYLSSYGHHMADDIRPSENEVIDLPRRILGDVYLSKGYMKGFETIHIIDEPVRLYCHNQTIGALQMKLRASNVRVVYEWMYGENVSRGRSVLKPQDIYLDVDIEKDGKSQPSVLGIYVSQPTDDNFQIEFSNNRRNQASADKQEITFHVLTVSKMAFSRDVKIALIYEFSPRIEKFIQSNDFSLD